MRFPSIAFVASEAATVWRRFPVTLLVAFAAAVVGVIAVEDDGNQEFFLRFLYTATLGLPLFVALTVYPGKRGWSSGPKTLVHLAGLAALVGFFMAWPHWNEPVALRRYFQLSLGCHLLVAVLPWLRPGELNGFWQFNKTLFIRFLVSALYAEVLFVGLAIAILALDKLFGLEVPGERYFQLWILIGFVFTTWFFLGGIPADLSRLESVTDYPRGLRIFSQFILLPLVAVYLLILTMYMGKIAITTVWPSGWIGYLVSSVAVGGILLLLLVFPIKERAENRWVLTYSRWFYILMLPSVTMLLLAIFKRIGQYGITENRYFIVVLAFWLAAISLYFILSRTKSIKVIPATLCILAFGTAFGPWGAYHVSLESQTARLGEMLATHDILVGGRVQKAVSDITFDDRRELSAVLSYLVETHGHGSIDGWFEDGLAWADTVGDEARGGNRWKAKMTAKQIMEEEMGLAYVEKWEREDQKSFNYWRPAPITAIPISGYDYSFPIENIHTASVLLDGESYELDYEIETVSLEFKKKEDVIVEIPLRDLIERAHRFHPGDTLSPGVADSMISQVENERIAILVLVRSLSGYTDEEGPRLTGFSGTAFVRF